MTATQVVKELEALGSDSYKRILFNHGVREPALGVKISELQKIRKRAKKDHQLALDLFDTGIYDAQYLAGLIADESKISRKDLARWVKSSNCIALCGTIVSQVAAESPHGWELGLEWIESKDEKTAQAGWETLSNVVSITDDAELDVPALKKLLQRVEKTIDKQPNYVRYSMNGFVIALGSYVAELTDAAMKTAEKIGEVTVDMGNTACEVPFAPDYIKKVKAKGSIGKKRKSARC